MAYSRLVCQLVVFLYRCAVSEDPQMSSMPIKIKEYMSRDVHRLLQGSDSYPNTLRVYIKSILWQLWTSSYNITPLEHFPDPTLRFIIHTQVNQDGSLKPPQQVTGVFAKMTYNIVRGLSPPSHSPLLIPIQRLYFLDSARQSWEKSRQKQAIAANLFCAASPSAVGAPSQPTMDPPVSTRFV